MDEVPFNLYMGRRELDDVVRVRFPSKQVRDDPELYEWMSYDEFKRRVPEGQWSWKSNGPDKGPCAA